MTPARLPLVLLSAFLAGAAGTSALAQEPPAKPPDTIVVPSNAVVVHAPIDPKVTSTFPADGASIPSGVMVLKVVFDQAMVPEAWSYGQAEGAAFPHCLAKPRLLNDAHVFDLLCTVGPSQDYAIQINAAPDFVSEHGRAAKPYLLRFKTTDRATYDMHAALKQAGLTEADEPIMTWNAAPGGVSDKPPPPRE